MTKTRYLKENEYRITNDNSIIRISKLTDKNIRKALRLRFKRIGIDNVSEYIKNIKKCAFCGDNNYTWRFDYIIEGKNITITGVSHRKDTYFCYITNNPCSGKNYNPNSTEYVAKIYGITLSEALELIHSRNASPFYVENHSNADEYKQYQGSRWNDKNDEEKKEIIDKANYSRSLEGYKERFGDVDGHKKWHEIQELKAITPKNLKRIYGEGWEHVYDNWKSGVVSSLENYIKRYGETDGPEKYKWHIDNLKKVSQYAYYGITTEVDGYLFRSKTEAQFYSYLKEYGLTNNIQVDDYYPNSYLRYDFYLKDINLYIEVCGMDKKFKPYWEKIDRKIKLFNPMLIMGKDVYSKTKMRDIMNTIKEMYELKNNDTRI